MANKYPLVSNSATKTIQELGVGDTLVVDNLNVVGTGNIGSDLNVNQNITAGGNVLVEGNITVQGSINANLGNVVVENFTVEGKSNLNNVGNLTITGGNLNEVLATNGSGNLYWANIQTQIANPAGANTYIQFNNNNSFGASANFTYNSATNTLNIQGTANISTGLFNGANAGTANIGNLNSINSNLGLVSNIKISGGSSGYVLSTDGSGNLSWVGIDPSVSGDGGNATSSVLLLASLDGGNALVA